jgi:outer membrane receptor protein involved in Fe transport
LKGKAFNNSLTYEIATYYIDWQKIQLITFTFEPAFGIWFVNAKSARSDGVELNLTWRPNANTTVSGWYNYNDAVLTGDFPSDSFTVGKRGDLLPFTSKNSANVSLNHSFLLADGWGAFVGVSESYVGAREDIFPSAFGETRGHFPAYWKTDLSAGLSKGPWEVDAYVNNVTNERGLLSGSLPANAIQIITPVNAGVSVRRRF